MNEKKKISLIGCVLMGIGCIIGSGIFGSLPELINTTGSGIVYALLLAAFVVILRSITRMYTISALPTSASTFMHATKLMHPYVGALISINAFLQPTMVALFGVLFATYFQELFPGCPLSSTTVSICLLVAFTVLAWFGNKFTISVGNIIVVVLLAAIAVYIICGLPHLDPENVSFLSVIKPGIKVSVISAAAGVLTSSLSGASAQSWPTMWRIQGGMCPLPWFCVRWWCVSSISSWPWWPWVWFRLRSWNPWLRLPDIFSPLS